MSKQERARTLKVAVGRLVLGERGAHMYGNSRMRLVLPWRPFLPNGGAKICAQPRRAAAIACSRHVY
jgi:hypothetical protein